MHCIPGRVVAASVCRSLRRMIEPQDAAVFRGAAEMPDAEPCTDARRLTSALYKSLLHWLWRQTGHLRRLQFDFKAGHRFRACVPMQPQQWRTCRFRSGTRTWMRHNEARRAS